MAKEIIVGPGETFTTISAAVVFADEFDTIRVKPGTYNETVVINKTIQLHGAQSGADARNRVGDESIVTSDTFEAGIIQVAADNVVVDGFTVQNNSIGSGISTSPSFSGYWIFNNIIQNNVFGLSFDSEGSTISQAFQNFIRNNNQTGAGSGTGIFSTLGSTNVLVDSNMFEGPHASASINFAGTSQNIIISNNQVNADNTIVLINTTNVKVERNTIVGTQGSSIFVGGSTNFTDIVNNTIKDSNSNGIRVANITGTANTNIRAKLNSIQGNATAGLNIAAGAYDDTGANRPLDATNNWWGSSTGPFPIGTGDAVIDPDGVAIITPFLGADPVGPTAEELVAICEQELGEVQARLVEFLPVIGNRLHNPSFELGLARWQTARIVTGERSATADEGERVAQLLPTTETGNAILSQMVKVAFQADFLGIEYSVRAIENPPNAPEPVSPALTVQILWYDGNFQLIRTDVVDQITQGALPIDTVWTRRAFTTNTKPEDTLQARLRFIASEGSSSALQLDNAVVGWRTA